MDKAALVQEKLENEPDDQKRRANYPHTLISSQTGRKYIVRRSKLDHSSQRYEFMKRLRGF